MTQRTDARPERTEAAEYFFTYMDQVPPGDIWDTLRPDLQARACGAGIVADPERLRG